MRAPSASPIGVTFLIPLHDLETMAGGPTPQNQAVDPTCDAASRCAILPLFVEIAASRGRAWAPKRDREPASDCRNGTVVASGAGAGAALRRVGQPPSARRENGAAGPDRTTAPRQVIRRFAPAPAEPAWFASAGPDRPAPSSCGRSTRSPRRRRLRQRETREASFAWVSLRQGPSTIARLAGRRGGEKRDHDRRRNSRASFAQGRVRRFSFGQCPPSSFAAHFTSARPDVVRPVPIRRP